MEIGSKIGKVLDVDVPEKGVQWGRYLRVRIHMDVTKKLIRAKKVCIENDKPRWVFFQYERLPNFCYTCGRIRHNERECFEKGETNGGVEKEKYQYGAWLRAEPMKRTGFSFGTSNRKSDEFDQALGGSWKEASTAERHVPHVTQTPSLGVVTSVQNSELTTGKIPNLPQEKDIGKESCQKPDTGLTNQTVEVQHATTSTVRTPEKAQNRTESKRQKDKSQVVLYSNGQTHEPTTEGLVAMLYDCEVGWVPEGPGPNSTYWKQIKREKTKDGPPIKMEPIGTKRPGPSSLQALDLNVPHTKKLKEKIERKVKRSYFLRKYYQREWRHGGGCDAAPLSSMTTLAWNCRGLGIPQSVQALKDLVRAEDPMLVFVMKMKASISQMKKHNNKIYRHLQALIVPSDGKNGGLALLWKENVDVRVQSYSHSHIDAIVHDSSVNTTWRATGFYGHPDTAQRSSSWRLLETLNAQFDLPWVVFGDFNEITHIEEKCGGAERDANQMEAFRTALDNCDLRDLGFAGQRFTWCNGRIGAQRTLVRLDRMVANSRWIELFQQAKV